MSNTNAQEGQSNKSLLVELEPLTESPNNDTTMAGPSITQNKQKIISGCFLVYTLIVGRLVSTQPSSEWSYFSWHPFLMICGLMGAMGVGAVTKKLGGYANTKMHGNLSSIGLCMALGGLYVIYNNKEIHGKPHITSLHAKMGLLTIFLAVGPAFFGAFFLHPDWGMDKTNQDYRTMHKWCARASMLSAYITGFVGLQKMTDDTVILALYALPLMIMAPMTLL